MGQAKRRGTYEQRKIAAISNRQAELAEQRRIASERESLMTQEQKKQRLDSRLFLARMMGLMIGMGR